MRRRNSWTDRCAVLALVFGLVGSFVGGEHAVLGALLGVITGVFVGLLAREHDKRVEREFKETWERIFCPICQGLWGTVRRSIYSKTKSMQCRHCGIKFTAEVPSELGLGE